MEQDEKVKIVQLMQNYIKSNIHNEDFSLNEMYQSIGYSKRHAERLFVELIHLTPMEYIRKIILSSSVKEVLETDRNIVDIALKSRYNSHEGYTKAFKAAFNISPNQYRKSRVAIPLFIQYPVKAYYTYLNHKERLEMDKNTMVCMITPVEKPKRKLIVLYSKSAQDYWSFCEEMGCEWEGLLNSIPEKMDVAAILELPLSFVKEGKSHVAAGIEVPFDYSNTIPAGYDTVELEAETMMYFQTEAFEEEEDFGVAISCVLRAIDNYNPNKYGYEYDFSIAPKFNYGASVDMGAKMALPVKRILQV